MVNRILIRIKVVQMLYSYLLTRTEFKIDTDPDLTSADKKFAHAAYIDMLMLLLELTGHNSKNINKASSYAVDKKLQAAALGKALATDSTIKELVFKGNPDMDIIAPEIQKIHDRITASAIYAEFRRKRKVELDDEVAMWTVLLESVIATDPVVLDAFRNLPGFSTVGFQLAIAKTVATLKSYYGARASYYQATKNLEQSLLKAHQLYISVFALIVALTRTREQQLETAKTKFLATAQDKNPNRRFVDNSLAAYLAGDEKLQQYCKEYGIDWESDYTLMTSLTDQIVKSKVYQEYMEAPDTDWNKDCEFWRTVMKNVIFPSDDFNEALENQSVYWNDDLQIIGTFALKTLRQAAQSDDHKVEFLPQYKDEEDARFGAELFEDAVRNRDKYYGYIEKFVDTENWDTDRMAFMDTVIMITAIAEIINYPNIPLPVTMNEYIDIANAYSSAKSGQFINGVLYSVVQYLKEQGVIIK